MSSKPKPAPSRPAPRLYLATPLVDDVATFAASLPAALEGIDVAAVLVRFAQRDPRGMTEYAKTLVPAIQRTGAAALLDGQPDIVARAGADGAHLTGIAALIVKNIVQQKISDITNSLAVKVPQALVNAGQRIGNLVTGGGGGAAGAAAAAT